VNKSSQKNVPQVKDTSFDGDLLRLVSGTAAASAVGILAAPILTRLFTPETFGIAALFTSITSILGILACMRYELAIVIAEEDHDAANLLGVCVLFSFFLASLTTVALWQIPPTWLDKANLLSLSPYFWMIPALILITGLFMAFSNWNTRTKNFSRLSIAQVTNQVSATSLKLLLGLSGVITGGVLIGSTVTGKGVATTFLGMQIYRDDRKFLKESISLARMITCVKRYRKFPMYGTWSILLGVGAWQLPVILLGSLFSTTIVGLYTLGFLVLELPMKLIGGALGQVFLKSAAVASKEELKQLVENLFDKLVMLSLFPMLMLTLIGEDLYTVVFGENWAEAGIYTQILSIWAFFWFLSAPFTKIFAIKEKQELQLSWNILNFAVRLGAIIIGAYYYDARMTIFILSVSGVAIYILKVILTLKLVNVSIIKSTLILAKYFSIFLPAGAFIAMLNVYEFGKFVILLSSAACVLIYFGALGILFSLKLKP
jgi:lipopolysaccharide exporter